VCGNLFQPDSLGTVNEAGLRFVGWFNQAVLGSSFPALSIQDSVSGL
jgi:hypothetical protein